MAIFSGACHRHVQSSLDAVPGFWATSMLMPSQDMISTFRISFCLRKHIH